MPTYIYNDLTAPWSNSLTLLNTTKIQNMQVTKIQSSNYISVLFYRNKYCNYNNATNKTNLEEININYMDKSRQTYELHTGCCGHLNCMPSTK